MTTADKVTERALRERFSHALSDMYCREAPAYFSLVKLVADDNYAFAQRTMERPSTDLLPDDRPYHGAIRLGTSRELRMMRRALAVLGMQPVGYYDLSAAGLPVHSTAFRPIAPEGLRQSPLRIFCSLLRLDLLTDKEMRAAAEGVLAKRDVFSPLAIDLIERAEKDGGLDSASATTFLHELLKIFQWTGQASVDLATYSYFDRSHRLVSDILSFKGPHINHLTVRALDIDTVHQRIPECGVDAKSIIEGPPKRRCPILLRQTAFRALPENVTFPYTDGVCENGVHTARFGEVESRGAALTPKGMALYDRLLTKVHAQAARNDKPSNSYNVVLKRVFSEFPDDWSALRLKSLAYFEHSLTDAGRDAVGSVHKASSIETLLTEGYVAARPITYEDFLPVSAAGIFRSNLGDEMTERLDPKSDQTIFEKCLGVQILDPLSLYSEIERSSIETCLNAFNSKVSPAA